MKEEGQKIKLDQFLKYSGLVATGGQAKVFIQSGHVAVNGEIETRRGRKLVAGDRVTFDGQTVEVVI
ncbi:MAG: RNA-binding S4 domain-containing protein [Limnospira sp.]